jgi:ribosome-associated protein
MALTSDQIDIGDTRVADFVITVLEEAKASDVRLLDVRQLTDITDYMVIANGTSSRHVVAMAERVREAGLKRELRPLAAEGEGEGEWIVLDYGDVVIHLMMPDRRVFYDLDGLWDPELGEILKQRRQLTGDG